MPAAAEVNLKNSHTETSSFDTFGLSFGQGRIGS